MLKIFAKPLVIGLLLGFFPTGCQCGGNSCFAEDEPEERDPKGNPFVGPFYKAMTTTLRAFLAFSAPPPLLN